MCLKFNVFYQFKPLATPPSPPPKLSLPSGRPRFVIRETLLWADSQSVGEIHFYF